MARGFGALLEDPGERLLAGVEELLKTHRPAASLLHGDLWGGNWLASADGEPVISIADDGPGIPVDERDHVFKRFYRLEQSRYTPGHGLGLSLVAAVARLHGARIELVPNAPGLKVKLWFAAVTG